MGRHPSAAVACRSRTLAMLSDRPRPGDEESDEPSRLAPVVGAAGEVDAPPPGSTQPTSSTSTTEHARLVPPHCHARAEGWIGGVEGWIGCGGLERFGGLEMCGLGEAG